ncbi:putative quinol monooxygenase [Mesorhizobium sp. WSM4976]|uniref:putative quinol monooxygenase n=1 Tax=Mesorhizobium sp. WSM4976 TaxID=3038549 RepID=UPI00241597D5|nr:putative quinol monooxygenase [Mesorhizobium sp. WSM4976]MDG4898727.1 putative quinol monooxygenase [Mesorhizobium sp. WSM4976]
MSGYAIIVDFVLVPGKQAEFRRLVDENARSSSNSEHGCRHFDVLESRGQADRIFLYEVYDDRAAFEAHVQSPHFSKFDRETAHLVTNKSVIHCDLVYRGRRPDDN